MKKTGTFFLNRDNLQMGLVLGFVFPLIIFMIIYFMRYSSTPFMQFFNAFILQKSMITFFGVWCLVGNIALFTYYVNTNKDRTAKGIFAITLLYGIAILLVKVLM